MLAVLKSAKLLKNDGTAEEKWNYDETFMQSVRNNGIILSK